MLIIFTPHPQQPDRLKVTFANGDVELQILERNGVLDEDRQVVVETDTLDALPLETFYRTMHVDLVKFNDPVNPTEVVVDMSAAIVYHMTELKRDRVNSLAVLDRLQVSALAKGEAAKAAAIEADKQVLRDMPNVLDTTNITTLTELFRLIPSCLLVDYEAKYKEYTQ